MLQLSFSSVLTRRHLKLTTARKHEIAAARRGLSRGDGRAMRGSSSSAPPRSTLRAFLLTCCACRLPQSCLLSGLFCLSLCAHAEPPRRALAKGQHLNRSRSRARSAS